MTGLELPQPPDYMYDAIRMAIEDGESEGLSAEELFTAKHISTLVQTVVEYSQLPQTNSLQRRSVRRLAYYSLGKFAEEFKIDY